MIPNIRLCFTAPSLAKGSPKINYHIDRHAAA